MRCFFCWQAHTAVQQYSSTHSRSEVPVQPFFIRRVTGSAMNGGATSDVRIHQSSSTRGSNDSSGKGSTSGSKSSCIEYVGLGDMEKRAPTIPHVGQCVPQASVPTYNTYLQLVVPAPTYVRTYTYGLPEVLAYPSACCTCCLLDPSNCASCGTIVLL